MSSWADSAFSCDDVHDLHSSRKAPPARIGRRGKFRCHRENVMLPYLRKVVRYQTNYVASKATHGPQSLINELGGQPYSFIHTSFTAIGNVYLNGGWEVVID